MKFSFSIPVYNAGRYLDACLKSIRAQDYPAENIEILIADGGSEDRTLEIARRYDCRIFDNPARLADAGAKITAHNATGETLIIYAADNEMPEPGGLRLLSDLFTREPELACVWGPMISGRRDSSLNRYYALIQNDPLSWFINQNLAHYLKVSRQTHLCGTPVHVFNVDPARPLIWGANGLAYRTAWVRDLITVPGFVGDNDVFQLLIEAGHNSVAYCPAWRTVHHHVQTLGSWGGKWRRDFFQHFLNQRRTRNMNWAFDRFFPVKLCLWMVYTLLVPVSLLHAVSLACKDRRPEWLWHPWAGLVQLGTYLWTVVATPQGRGFVREIVHSPRSRREMTGDRE